MSVQLDVGKLVGAASAPVALIIAGSIFLSNLGAKYALLAGMFREASKEYRQRAEAADVRCESLERQLALYSRRLRHLIRATSAMGISILCFILTVLFTSVGVLFPGAKLWLWITGLFSFAGMLILSGAVIVEIIENHSAKQALLLETAEFPHALEGEASGKKLQEDVRQRNAA